MASNSRIAALFGRRLLGHFLGAIGMFISALNQLLSSHILRRFTLLDHLGLLLNQECGCRLQHQNTTLPRVADAIFGTKEARLSLSAMVWFAAPLRFVGRACFRSSSVSSAGSSYPVILEPGEGRVMT